jgi:hypothetical protein
MWLHCAARRCRSCKNDGTEKNNSSAICALKDLHPGETQEGGVRAGFYPALSGGGTGRYAVDSRHGRQDSTSGADPGEVEVAIANSRIAKIGNCQKSKLKICCVGNLD